MRAAEVDGGRPEHVVAIAQVLLVARGRGRVREVCVALLESAKGQRREGRSIILVVDIGAEDADSFLRGLRTADCVDKFGHRAKRRAFPLTRGHIDVRRHRDERGICRRADEHEGRSVPGRHLALCAEDEVRRLCGDHLLRAGLGDDKDVGLNRALEASDSDGCGHAGTGADKKVGIGEVKRNAARIDGTRRSGLARVPTRYLGLRGYEFGIRRELGARVHRAHVRA